MSEQEKKPEVASVSPRADTATAEAEMAALRQQLEAKEQEAKANYERFLRQVADSENFKKRLTREREESIRFANENFIKDLLPVVDNLERAVAHAQGGGNGQPLIEGVEMVLKSFLEVLSKHGVTQIDAMGKCFDPSQHEAIAQIEAGAHAPNTVVEEHHKGYFLKARLLRPALVSVATANSENRMKTHDNEVEKPPSDD